MPGPPHCSPGGSQQRARPLVPRPRQCRLAPGDSRGPPDNSQQEARKSPIVDDTPHAAPRRQPLFRALLALACLVFLLLAYGLAVVIRGAGLYEWVKQRELEPMQTGRFVGKAYGIAPALGPVPATNGAGVWLIPRGAPVPFRHGEEGLRIPLRGEPAVDGRRHPRVLFLGDSFTYGMLVAAEDAFAFRSAQQLQGEALNAGVPGHGLAQMVLRARRLIPRYKPDYVVVQYSPWLVGRAQSEFMPGSGDMFAVPYYADDGAGGMRIAPAWFAQSPDLLSRLEQYKTTPRGVADELSFVGRAALPLITRRDASVAVFRARQWLGLSPTPSPRPEAIVRAAYAEIDGLARRNGGQMVVLVLLNLGWPLAVPEDAFPPQAPRINAWDALVARIEPQPDAYVRHYFLWRGNPAEPVDPHPSEEAHAVIADLVAGRIRQLEQQKGAARAAAQKRL